jgi:hypothetical protein
MDRGFTVHQFSALEVFGLPTEKLQNGLVILSSPINHLHITYLLIRHNTTRELEV